MLGRDKAGLLFWKQGMTTTDHLLQDQIHELGFRLDTATGQLFYQDNFQPMELKFELCYIRHGETYGNCGQSLENGEIDFEAVEKGLKNKDKRIFQGDVDTKINQLTAHGQQQANDLAIQFKKEWIEKNWIPDVVLVSPLGRAINTAKPLVEQNQLQDKLIILDALREACFGAWENRRICDLPAHDPCHTFYLEQNSLVKQSGKDGNGKQRAAENFCEVMLRVQQLLIDLNEKYAGKKVAIVGHSMVGAAFCFILGHGQKMEKGKHLAFDGKDSKGVYYTMPHATPILLKPKMPEFLNLIKHGL